MIVLRGYEILVMQSPADLVIDDTKKGNKGTLYLTNTRLVFEVEQSVLRDILLDLVRSIEEVTEYEIAVSYMTNRTDKSSRDVFRILNRDIHKNWMNTFKKYM